MKYFSSFLLFVFASLHVAAKEKMLFYKANHPAVKYMGRTDISAKTKPKVWASAAEMSFSFKGSSCKVVITDEELYGRYHNYIDIIVDDTYRRIKLKSKTDTILIAENLPAKVHSVRISKSTEAGIGYIQFDGIICNKLVKTASATSRKIESFGDSITSGMGNDTTALGCHKADWYDQTNGYMSYAAITGRALNAQYHLNSVSGIGIIHSCCNMEILMPQVYDKISLSENKIAWDFKRYQPDVVTVCLGQNDGVQDSAKFCTAYISFVEKLRSHYPKATFILLSSPMADATLLAATKKYLPAVTAHFSSAGDHNVYHFYFSRQSVAGCDSHPSLSQHEQIAGELTAYLKELMHW
jgi:Carbohydrate esterase 2 N-terminal/GDSL-like Lipase/Acylhydrolase family